MHILTCFVNLWLNLFWSLDVISKPSHFRNKVNGHKIWQMSVCLCVWRFPRSELPSAQQRLLVFPTEKKKKNSSSFSYKHSNLHTYLWVCYVTSPKTGSHKIQKKKKNLKTLSSTSVAKCRLWHEFNLWKQALDYKPGRRWPYGAFKLCGRFCVCAKRALKSHKITKFCSLQCQTL